MQAAKMFSHYARFFNTAEINSAFHHACMLTLPISGGMEEEKALGMIIITARKS